MAHNESRHGFFHWLLLFIKGGVIGATMSIPGVSGGTMAILLGIYDRLVGAVGSFFKDAKKNIAFLGVVAAGGLLGVWLLSKPLLHLLETYPKPMTYFFLGVVAGSIPMLLRKARVTRLTSSAVLFPLIGAAIMVVLWLIPEGFLTMSFTGWKAWAILVVVGLFTAAAFVLPGISFTYTLLLLGIYETCLEAIHSFNWDILIPIGIGLVLGTILVAKILETCMARHPQGTFLIITGFVVSSIILQLFDKDVGWPTGSEIAICVLVFLVGMLFVLAISKTEKKR